MKKKLIRLAEFIILFFGVPILLYFDRNIIHPSILLLPVLIFVILILRYRTNFKIRELVFLKISRKVWQINILIVMLTFVILLAGTILFERENLFNLLRGNPLIFIAMSIFYPVFSAYSQEIIYRTFLYHRYSILFNSRFQFILASSISFSFMHIVYYSAVSMSLTLVMGVYLSYVYWHTRSVLFTAILHGIFGILVFAVGLGQYFWLDMPVP